ncbi:MAG: GntR family transcriptional regulator [Planctomycetes bacterium]|nr:GntR family transcriptional regulator [Planctomycetota bacterium]
MWRKPDPKAAASVSEQIARQLRARIAGDELGEGERLPSVRALATELLVNPNTVAKVYRELEQAGLVVTRPGSGVSVAPKAQIVARDALRRDLVDRLSELLGEARTAGFAGEDLDELLMMARRALVAGGVE